MILKILIGVAAVAFGMYLGRPARYDRSLEEVDRALDAGRSRRYWTKRHFTPLDLLRKEKKGSERRRVRRHFKTAVPNAPAQRDDEDGPPKVRLGSR